MTADLTRRGLLAAGAAVALSGLFVEIPPL
jgi:hypothetical protein